ncbi:MAG: HAMP domain-containing histidine kinase [Aeriscardovia sp.]|nr:HAMP domain-containing histidine kinase [Aeriscardovia sp.]
MPQTIDQEHQDQKGTATIEQKNEQKQPSDQTKRKKSLSWKYASIPLSAKLISTLLILLIIGFSAAAFATRQLMLSYMVNRTDEQLMEQAQLVLNDMGFLSDRNRDAGPMPTNYFLQIRNASNEIVSTPLIPVMRDGSESIPDLPKNGQAGDLKIGIPTTVKSDVIRTVSSKKSIAIAKAPWRVVKLQWQQPATGQSGILYIGLSLSDAIDTASTISCYFFIIALAIILIAVAIGSLVITNMIKPLQKIEKTAAKIAGGDLSQRLPDLPQNTEVGSLSSSLNTMLSKIEQSFKEKEKNNQKMKRFVSDASHELRTPLAAIHGYAELYRMQREEPGALERADTTIARIEASSTRMTSLVNDLLTLARLDDGHRGADITKHVQIDSLIYDSCEDLHALDSERPIQFGSLVFPKKHMRFSKRSNRNSDFNTTVTFKEGKFSKIKTFGDPLRLRQVFTNIVGNIHRYTPSDSPVEISLNLIHSTLPFDKTGQLSATTHSFNTFMNSLTTNDDAKSFPYALIRFIDHGPGVKPEALDLLFERFYTADASRAREKGGTGLGMAIAQSVTAAHSGFISATATPQHGLTINIILPIRTESPIPSSTEYALGK